MKSYFKSSDLVPFLSFCIYILYSSRFFHIYILYSIFYIQVAHASGRQYLPLEGIAVMVHKGKGAFEESRTLRDSYCMDKHFWYVYTEMIRI